MLYTCKFIIYKWVIFTPSESRFLILYLLVWGSRQKKHGLISASYIFATCPKHIRPVAIQRSGVLVFKGLYLYTAILTRNYYSLTLETKPQVSNSDWSGGTGSFYVSKVSLMSCCDYILRYCV